MIEIDYFVNISITKIDIIEYTYANIIDTKTIIIIILFGPLDCVWISFRRGGKGREGDGNGGVFSFQTIS